MFNSSKEIADLKEKLQASEANLATATQNLEKANTDLAAEQAKSKDLDGKLTAANTRITQLEADKLKAEADLNQYKADFEQKVEAEVVNRAAAAGIEPVKRDLKAGTHAGATGDNVKTRKEFETMSAKERGEFFKNGGKLKD